MPKGTVYMFGDDLQFFEGAAIRRMVRGSSPHRDFIVEWHDIGIFAKPTMQFSAEVIFSEDGRIAFNYKGLATDQEKGGGALVGLKSPKGTAETWYLVHEPRLKDGEAIVYKPSS